MILDGIAAHARERVAARRVLPRGRLRARAEAPAARRLPALKKALAGREAAFICEIKRPAPRGRDRSAVRLPWHCRAVTRRRARTAFLGADRVEMVPRLRTISSVRYGWRSMFPCCASFTVDEYQL